MTRAILALYTFLFFVSSVGYCEFGINPCRITGVPDEIGPNDKIALFAQGSCSERYVSISVFRLDGSEVGDAVEFSLRNQPVMSLGNSYISRWPHGPYSILFIEPARPWKIGSKYRIEVYGLRRNPSESLHLTTDEWKLVNPGKGMPQLGYFVPSAFADFAVADREVISVPQTSPRLTGHTIAKNKYPFPSYQVKLCAEDDPEISKHPDSFLYVVELESSTGDWTWISAWKPEDYGDKKSLCAYVVGPETIPNKQKHETGEFRFRLKLLRTDGKEWTGEYRSVETAETDARKN